VKIMAIQDNLSKVQAVEQLTQQMLRFPDDVQMAMAGEVRKQRQLRKRQVNKSGKADEGKLRPKGELRRMKKDNAVSILGCDRGNSCKRRNRTNSQLSKQSGRSAGFTDDRLAIA